MKTCTICQINAANVGRRCRSCIYKLDKPNLDKKALSEYHKKWYKKNKKRILAKQKAMYNSNLDHKQKVLKRNIDYRNKNKEEINQQNRIYGKLNRKKLNKWSKNRYKTNIQHRLSVNLRTRLNKAIKNKWKTGSSVSDLGCTIEFLINHLESNFQSGMTWKNQGKVWHIDHIIPLFHFNLEDRNEFLKACHYTNLQPMFAKENLKKNKYIQENEVFNVKKAR